MAEREEIEITAKDLTEAGVESAKKNMRSLGDTARKSGEVGRLGMFALGESAENAAQSLGVPNQVSRQLGNSVERMASSLGVAGLALGAVGLAAASAVLIWRKYREEQEKIREEKIKAGLAAGAWITGILNETANTRELVAAKKEMAQAEFDINRARIEQAFPALLAKQAELQAKYNLELKRSIGEAFVWIGTWEDAKKKAEGFRLELNMVNAQLALTTAQQKLFSDQNRERTGDAKGGKSLEETAAERNARAIEQIEYRKNLAILALRDQLAADNLVRYQEEQRVNAMRMQAVQDITGNMAQTFMMLSQLNTSHARRYFSIYKVAAIGETIISTARGAMKAYAEFGPFGGAAAAAIIALGAAKVALIRAQSFDGGGGAVGTFAANPATGLPATGGAGGGPSSITININGQKAGEYELASGVLRTIYNNNGSVDGFALEVVRSA